MFIIVGLGNPGTKFKNTRHNVGFLALDEFAKQNGFDDFKLQKKFEAETSSYAKTSEDKQEIILVKPQTFMNDSGRTVKKIVKSIPSLREGLGMGLIVIHDDIDLPTGSIKIVKDRGSAGHKGVESIIKEIGTSDFVRFRIGIALEKETKAKNIVLKKFSPEEKEKITDAIKKTSEALNYFLQNGLEKTMSEYNR